MNMPLVMLIPPRLTHGAGGGERVPQAPEVSTSKYPSAFPMLQSRYLLLVTPDSPES
jgi:hypothetical protein